MKVLVVLLLVVLELELLELDRSGECEGVEGLPQVGHLARALTRSGLSVRLPDLGQLCLLPELLRVVGAVLDGVGLVAGVVTDGADVNIEGGADHSTTRVLENMGGVDCLRLIVVLQQQKYVKYQQNNRQTKSHLAEHAVSRQFLGLLHFLLGLIFKSWRNIFKSAG